MTASVTFAQRFRNDLEMCGCYTGASAGRAGKRGISLNGGESGPDYASYLLRMWREGDAGGPSDEEDRPVWRASIVSTLTGKRQGFASLDALFDFLRRHESTMLNRHLNRDQGREGRDPQDGIAT
jgi:hypothetical protein